MDAKVHKQYQDIQEDHWLFRVRENLLLDLAETYFEKGQKVLDFGCNYGHAVRILQERGYHAEGYDISEEAIAYGRSQGIKNIFSIPEKKLSSEHYDAAITFDVLEHIQDDAKAFSEIAATIKKGGHLIIVVPAYMFLWGMHDVVAHHFRRYTLSELVSLSEKIGGFEIVRKSYFNTFLFIPITIFRLGSRLLKLESRDSDFDINNPILDRLFFGIFNAERKLLRYISFPFGVSALLVLRKK